MAIPLTMNADSPPARGYASTVRFTRRRDVRRRHNPNVDAAWWPRSSNLTVELAHLLQVARESGFYATGVAYRLDDGWPAPPEEVEFGARKVKVSGYHNHHRDMITLVDGISHERLQVMVVPAETPPLLARRGLRIAAVHADPIQGTDLLALARGETRTAVVTG
jgi:Family of unknown function (DUF5994)